MATYHLRSKRSMALRIQLSTLEEILLWREEPNWAKVELTDADLSLQYLTCHSSLTILLAMKTFGFFGTMRKRRTATLEGSLHVH